MQILFKDTGKIRFDKWLAYKFPEKSREFFNHNIKNGKILLNKIIVKPSIKLQINDEIDIDDKIFEQFKVELLPNKTIKLKIVFENDDFAIIDKPAGLLVHPVKADDNNTLVNALIHKWPKIINVGDDPLRPGIVHRLDKDTSGLMIIVKNQLAFKSFKIKFQNHKVQKIYMALIYGKLKNKSGTINTPIARSKNKFNHRKITLDNSGKEAITDYEVIKEFEKTSLIKAYPKTGRTHQIRVHLSSMSNYIIGDNEYGSSRINKKYNITRQFLHSTELIFDYKREKYHFISKLPKDLSTWLKQFEQVD